MRPPKGGNFSGAGGETIERYGEADVLMTGENGANIGITWQAANVSRALHSISKIAGPEEGDGRHDVLFNNKVGVVVPPGIVNAIIGALEKRGKAPTATYRRKGGLYLAKMKMKNAPGFTRPAGNA